MRRVLFALPLIAGLVAAIVLTMPSVARAWDINTLPPGYSITLKLPAGQDCTTYNFHGYGSDYYEADCPSDAAQHAAFLSNLNDWIESTCPQAVCHPAPPVTTTAATAPVTTTAPVVTDTSATTTTAPTPVDTTVTTTPAPQTVTVTTVITDPSITSRLDLIEQRQATDEARITQLEHPVVPGLAPLGEPKNVSPFVA